MASQAWNANVSLSDGLWHYWVWTIEEEVGQKLYIDGELVGNSLLDYLDYDMGSRLIIGYSSASTQPHFIGTIDEVKVHEVVLNSTTIDKNFKDLIEQKEKPKPLNSKFYGHWTFDTLIDSNLTKDSFGFHNHAIVKGATITKGVKNNALYFDGISDEVEVLIDRPKSNISIELWFKTNLTNMGLVSILTNSEIIDDNNLNFYLINGKPHQEIMTSQAWNANVSLSDGLWHYWVWTIEKEVGQKLYIDGELVGNSSLDHLDYDMGSRLIIGYSSASTQPYFIGTIDEVKVHEVVLNSTTIDENFKVINKEFSNTDYNENDDENDINYIQNLLIFMLIVVGIVVLVGKTKYRKDKN